MKDILLITPPFTQLNTPYPATCYLKGFLNTKNISSFQMDLGLEVILSIYSKPGLTELFEFANQNNQIQSENAQRIYASRQDYIQSIEGVVSFLQGSNPNFARLAASGNFLPQASRFSQLDYLDWAFGSMGLVDKAKHLSTLFLEDLSDFIVECVDSDFGVSRYAEQLGQSAHSFDDLYNRLQNPLSYIENRSVEILMDKIEEVDPKMICFSVPFPGNLTSAFRCAQQVKIKHPKIVVAMGGGYPNTELRQLKDSRVFKYIDFITLDDGELPIELLHKHVVNSKHEKIKSVFFKRTFMLEDGEVYYNNLSLQKDYPQHELGTPDYSDLPLQKYISVIEIANPMHSLWNDGKWLKLTMAHGCYWGKCTFCDVSLDYIKNYEPLTAKLLVDRMETMMAQTGETGFHFVDEAAPPALMRALAIEIIQRKIVVSWWTNIRFEKSFSADLCRLLSASGCVAVSGGLEVASNRLLKLIQKGVTVEQVAQVTSHFTNAGILVHSYLMYGYPTQTVQETIDSLEMVRQLFELNVVQSGFWHQFSLTAHSPIGMNPDSYGVIPKLQPSTFAYNDIDFEDVTGIDHDKFRDGLNKSLYNFMHGVCFEYDLQEWFEFKIPKTQIPADFILNAIEAPVLEQFKSSAKLLWIGHEPTIHLVKTKGKKGSGQSEIILTNKQQSIEITLETAKAKWLLSAVNKTDVSQTPMYTFGEFQLEYTKAFDDFETFWFSEEMYAFREMGLLVL